MGDFNRRGILSLGACAGALSVAMPGPAGAQSAEEQRLHDDWAYLSRYREDNDALRAAGVRVESVFLGDSITQGWRDTDASFFTDGRVGRGISGQTTPQMLVRMRQDVIDLNPRIVHIMAGTNDVAGNTGPMTPQMSQGNLMSMTEVARANGIRVILASIPPAAHFPWRPEVAPAAPIVALNAWLREYAQSVGAVYADYHAAMSDANGAMLPRLASDGVHPNAAGYAVMRPIAEAALALAARG
jgi:lysophospholipase L1-like esterase